MRSGFIYNEVITGLKRNITMTIAMILTTGISLALFGGGLLTVKMADKTKEQFLDRLELQIFLDDFISKVDNECLGPVCSRLKQDLENTSGVESVTFMNKETVYKDAKRVFENQKQIQDLIEANAFPAAFRVKVVDGDKFDEVKYKFLTRTGVSRIVDQRQLLDRIFSILKGVRNAAFAIAALQAIAAILLMANTVQISAFTRRDEVGIMRLVGATRWYTQLPFLLETIISAILGTLLAIVGVFIGKALFLDKALSSLYGVNIIARASNTDVVLTFPWLVLVGVAAAASTSYVTLRLYVRD